MPAPPPKDTAAAREILRQRDRILASDLFRSSERLSRFLDYLITQSLGEDRPQLKEFAIGVAVFERDGSFDPRIDSIVRVEASRLRAKLREYYDEIGQGDPWLITVPKGGYVPSFTPLDAREAADDRLVPDRPDTLHRRWWRSAVVVAAAAILAGVALWRITEPGESAIPTHRIAVLPLRDWSGATDDYFSEAMTDVLIARLSQRPNLRVTSLGSVLRFRDTDQQPADIAEQLGVGYLVEGTILRADGLVRISASLIDPATDESLWARTYERPLTNVVALQDDVASQIGMHLMGELDAFNDGQSSGDEAREIDPRAYEAFLKGRYWRNRLTAAGYNRGIRYFQEAIDIQPDFAEGYAGLAACHCRLGGHGIEVVAPGAALPRAMDLARKSLELDSSLAEPNALLGIIHFKYEWDARAAESYLQRALALNPSLFEASLWLSQVLEGMGRHDEAVAQARRAYETNPLSGAANLNLGWQLLQAGQTDSAEAHFDRFIEFEPEFWGAHWGKGNCHLARRRYAKAAAEFRQAVALEGGHTLPKASLGYAYAVGGERDKARAVVDELRTLAAVTYVSPVHIAMVYSGLGERDAAFEWLDRAREVRARSVAWLAVMHEFDALRDDPRFRAILRAVASGTHQ